MLFVKARRHLGRVARLLRRPPADHWLVVRAFVLLGHSRFLIKRRGLAAIEPLLGERMTESPTTISPEAAATAARIGWAVAGASLYTPWTSNCFPQAVAARRLLQRGGVDSTVYFGAALGAPGGTERLSAHAWVRCGEIYLTGDAGRPIHEAIVWFSDG